MSFDYDLFVVGGGSGGVRAARIAAGHGARVAIAEEHRYGGTCVIRGCVPKKLFVYASEFGNRIRDAAGYGWQISGQFDWGQLRARKDAEIDRLNGIYKKILTDNRVAMIDGHATLLDRHTIAVGERTISTDKILLATGSSPRRPDIPGVNYAITSNEAFYLETFPRRIAVVGGGYIGLEFATIFLGLGAEVTLVHHRAEVLRGFDKDIRRQVAENLAREGITVMFETEVASIAKAGQCLEIMCSTGASMSVDVIMFAIGRVPNTENMGLAHVGVELGPGGQVVVDEQQKTSVDNIYAVGDCTGRMSLTPVAIRQGQAFADHVFGNSSTMVDLSNVPTAVFCQPEVATVGLTEQEARDLHTVHIFRSTFTPLYHTLSGRNEKVLVKLVVDSASDRVLGVHMVGHGVAEIIQAAAIALQMGARKSDFDRTLALHPTTAEELVLMKSPEA